MVSAEEAIVRLKEDRRWYCIVQCVDHKEKPVYKNRASYACSILLLGLFEELSATPYADAGAYN